jgi:hypothetical protein
LLAAAAVAFASSLPRLDAGLLDCFMGAGQAKDVELHANGRRKRSKGVEYGDDGSTARRQRAIYADSSDIDFSTFTFVLT